MPLTHVHPLIFDIGGVRSLYFNFDGLQSSMRRGQPCTLEVDYTRTMMAFMLAKAQPTDILMVGLGGGSLPKFCHHNLAARITVVEVNPHIIALREQFEIPRDDDRLCIVQADAAHYVRDLAPTYDVILVDGFDHLGQPPELCTLEFYTDCHRALRDGGIMVVNLQFEKSYALSMRRIGEAFDASVVSIEATEKANCIVFASKGPPMSIASASVAAATAQLGDEGRAGLLPELRRVMAMLDEIDAIRRFGELE